MDIAASLIAALEALAPRGTTVWRAYLAGTHVAMELYYYATTCLSGRTGPLLLAPRVPRAIVLGGLASRTVPMAHLMEASFTRLKLILVQADRGELCPIVLFHLRQAVERA